MANRRKFISAFKAKVTIEALEEKEILSELSRRFDVPQEIIRRWKGDFLKLSTDVMKPRQRKYGLFEQKLAN